MAGADRPLDVSRRIAQEAAAFGRLELDAGDVGAGAESDFLSDFESDFTVDSFDVSDFASAFASGFASEFDSDLSDVEGASTDVDAEEPDRLSVL